MCSVVKTASEDVGFILEMMPIDILADELIKIYEANSTFSLTQAADTSEKSCQAHRFFPRNGKWLETNAWRD